MAMLGLLGNQNMILTNMMASDDGNLFISLSNTTVKIADTLFMNQISELHESTNKYKVITEYGSNRIIKSKDRKE